MLKLIIGNKNYSSWSLRPWLLMTEAGIPFEEVRLSLFTPEFAAAIGRYSPAKRVPVLIDEASPRARARSICAEMHAGFSTLRNAMPMNISTDLSGYGWSVGVQADVDRLVAMWREVLEAHGGPLLFGRFTIADAYFAPVVSRLKTYGVALPDDIAAYRDAVLGLPAMQSWTADARRETEFLEDDEPYRRRAAR
jgi:glutathione S-transferase